MGEPLAAKMSNLMGTTEMADPVAKLSALRNELGSKVTTIPVVDERGELTDVGRSLCPEGKPLPSALELVRVVGGPVRGVYVRPTDEPGVAPTFVHLDAGTYDRLLVLRMDARVALHSEVVAYVRVACPDDLMHCARAHHDLAREYLLGGASEIALAHALRANAYLSRELAKTVVEDEDNAVAHVVDVLELEALGAFQAASDEASAAKELLGRNLAVQAQATMEPPDLSRAQRLVALSESLLLSATGPWDADLALVYEAMARLALLDDPPSLSAARGHLLRRLDVRLAAVDCHPLESASLCTDVADVLLLEATAAGITLLPALGPLDSAWDPSRHGHGRPRPSMADARAAPRHPPPRPPAAPVDQVAREPPAHAVEEEKKDLSTGLRRLREACGFLERAIRTCADVVADQHVPLYLLRRLAACYGALDQWARSEQMYLRLAEALSREKGCVPRARQAAGPAPCLTAARARALRRGAAG